MLEVWQAELTGESTTSFVDIVDNIGITRQGPTKQPFHCDARENELRPYLLLWFAQTVRSAVILLYVINPALDSSPGFVDNHIRFHGLYA